MISIGEYSIEQYPNENKLVIYLPQAVKTLISERRTALTNNQLAVLVFTAKTFYENGTLTEDNTNESN